MAAYTRATVYLKQGFKSRCVHFAETSDQVVSLQQLVVEYIERHGTQLSSPLPVATTTGE